MFTGRILCSVVFTSCHLSVLDKKSVLILRKAGTQSRKASYKKKSVLIFVETFHIHNNFYFQKDYLNE